MKSIKGNTRSEMAELLVDLSTIFDLDDYLKDTDNNDYYGSNCINDNPLALDESELNDLLNYSNTQLEQVIFNQMKNDDQFCQDFGNLSVRGLSSNTEDFPDIKPSQGFYSSNIAPYSPSYDYYDDDESHHPCCTEPFVINEKELSSNLECIEVANYEEVYTSEAADPEQQHLEFLLKCCEDQSVDDQIAAADIDDKQSVDSYETVSTSSPNKRKLDSDNDDEEDKDQRPSTSVMVTRRKRRRINRKFDEKVKYQNKVASQKYRARKQHEKNELDARYEKEEQENNRLKNQVEEITVQIRVLKELLANYLSSNTLTSAISANNKSIDTH